MIGLHRTTLPPKFDYRPSKITHTVPSTQNSCLETSLLRMWLLRPKRALYSRPCRTLAERNPSSEQTNEQHRNGSHYKLPYRQLGLRFSMSMTVSTLAPQLRLVPFALQLRAERLENFQPQCITKLAVPKGRIKGLQQCNHTPYIGLLFGDSTNSCTMRKLENSNWWGCRHPQFWPNHQPLPVRATHARRALTTGNRRVHWTPILHRYS